MASHLYKFNEGAFVYSTKERGALKSAIFLKKKLNIVMPRELILIKPKEAKWQFNLTNTIKKNKKANNNEKIKGKHTRREELCPEKRSARAHTTQNNERRANY